MKNRKRLLKTVGLLTAATVMTVSFNAESVLAYSTGEEAAIAVSEEDPYENVTKINLKDMFNQNQEDYYVYFYMVQCPFCNQVKDKILNFAAENDNVSWEDFGKKTAAELNMEFKTASKLKIPEGKHTLSITDKHGHKSILKVWKDTKAPKIKVTRKGKKITCKITDKSGIDEVNGKKISKNGKIIKSYTVKGDCVVSDLAGNESVSYSFK